jgi:nucleoside 2-deoxyribosyltransferase
MKQNAEIIYPPYDIEQIDKPMLFMAGSIEMGKAEEWQSRLAKELASFDIAILNPRRKDWDNSWKQSISNPKFKEQVEWELRGIELADLAVFYFDPDTKSPITLFELGYRLAALSPHAIVCCPDNYWRKGNVEIYCNKINVPFYNDWDSFVNAIKSKLPDYID